MKGNINEKDTTRNIFALLEFYKIRSRITKGVNRNVSKHGEYITEGEWKDSRWCEVHKTHHGILYPCPDYPPELLKEIAAADISFAAQLNDKAWAQEQINKGVPPEAIEIMKIFSRL
jgi:hypothetical protein